MMILSLFTIIPLTAHATAYCPYCGSTNISNFGSVWACNNYDCSMLFDSPADKPPVYTVTWKNWDGTVLETDTDVVRHATPEYNGETPTKEEDDEYTYEFAGRTPAPWDLTADTEYTATFTAIPKSGTETPKPVCSYSIQPYYGGSDYDYGKLAADATLPYNTMTSTLVIQAGGNALNSYYYIQSVSLAFGTNATLGTPTGTPGESGYDVPVTITGPGEFYPTINRTGSWGEFSLRVVVTENAPTYTVTWKNWDGTVLEEDTNLEKGETPVYDGETPTKAEDNEYTYEFAGWTPEVTAVTGDAEYTATFAATKIIPLTNKSSVESEIVPTGSTITVTGAAEGGAGDYTFEYSYRRFGSRVWTAMSNGTTPKFRTEGVIELKSVVTDKNGASDEMILTATVRDPLENTSTAPGVNAGERAVINGSATGGAGDYTYTYYYKKSTSRNWNLLGEENTTAESVSFKTSRSGAYDVKVIVTDSEGTQVEKLMTLGVRTGEELKNNTTISATEVAPGTRVYINTAAEGGTSVYSWSVRFKRPSANKWTELTVGSDGIASFKPAV